MLCNDRKLAQSRNDFIYAKLVYKLKSAIYMLDLSLNVFWKLLGNFISHKI